MKINNKDLSILYDHLFNLDLSDRARKFIENTDPQTIPNFFSLSNTVVDVENIVIAIEDSE